MMTPWIYVTDQLPKASGAEPTLTLVSVVDTSGHEYVTAAFYYPRLKAWLDYDQPMNVYAWTYMPKAAKRP